MSATKIWIVASILILLASCSSVQFAYNRLDWLISYRISDYVSLSDAQEEQLDSLLEQQLRWHRSTQLPVYARSLQSLRSKLETGLQRRDLDTLQTEWMGYYQVLVQQLTPPTAELLRSLSDGQVQELLQAAEQNLQKYQTEWVAVTAGQVRAERAEQMAERLERWLGELNPSQQAKIRAWSNAIEITGSETLAYRQRWLAAMAELLQTRQQPGFATRLQDFILSSETLQSATLQTMRQQNRELFKEFIVTMMSSMSSGQQQYLQQQLARLAEDFIVLAKQS